MSTQLKYVPIFRGRMQEFEVLKSFNFGNNIYPYLEIIKEVIRKDPKPRKGAKKPSNPKQKKSFEDDYLPFISNIDAKQVFLDLPVHLEEGKGMKIETLEFLRSVVKKREIRTEYIKKLIPLGPKVIPVISTYSEVNGEIGSISIQEWQIRPYFKRLAFRTFPKTFDRDLPQIRDSINDNDYIIMDWGNLELDLDDGEIQDIVGQLIELDCHIITHRNSFPTDITMSGLEHDKIVESIDNSLMDKYKELAGDCFSDYTGIKKDGISKGASISPGFIYYDAVYNQFYGYRYRFGGHKKNDVKPKLDEFETRITPSVINSDATRRMQNHSLDFLGVNNKGWSILKNIELGVQRGGESGRSPAKFKRIGMEHYLHCIRCKISNGDFD